MNNEKRLDLPKDRTSENEEELNRLKKERDQAIAARDQLMQEVLPFAISSRPTTRKNAIRWPMIVALALIFGFSFFVLLKLMKQKQRLQHVTKERMHQKKETLKPATDHKADFAHDRSLLVLAIKELASLTTMEISPDEALLIIGGTEGKIVLMDRKSFNLRRSLLAHQGEVSALAFIDNQRFISGGRDGSIKLWRQGNLDKPLVIRKSGAPIRDLVTTERHLYVAAEQRDIEVYQFDGKALPALKGHKDWVRALAIHRAKRYLASGGHDRIIRLWDLKNNRVIKRLKKHRLWVNALAFDRDGERLASTGFSKKTYLWDVKTGKLLHTLRGHVRRVVDLSFSANNLLLTSSLDRKVSIWYSHKGKVKEVLKKHRYQVNTARMLRNRSIISLSSDGYLRVWGSKRDVPKIEEILPKPKAGELTFRSNTSGERHRVKVYDEKGKLARGALKQLAYIFRSGPDDRMILPDKKLVKMIYDVSEHFGRDHEILIISGHRSAEYNRVRTKQSRQVAKKSKHIEGKALDFRIDGITITALHRFLKKKSWGGLGFYADSQFVHLDSGPVRFWEGN